MYKQLILKAMEAREKAYCPYLNFKVGAAILFENGKIYTGSNIENASFGATNCAERTAIFTGIHDGAKEIKAIALIGDINNYTFPCGICRQVMQEFCGSDFVIIVAKSTDDYKQYTLAELLPEGFGGDSIQ